MGRNNSELQIFYLHANIEDGTRTASGSKAALRKVGAVKPKQVAIIACFLK